MSTDSPTDRTPLPTTPTAAPKPPAPTGPASNTLAWFAQNLLRGLRVPVTQANLNFVLSWARREGGGGAFNPLNTTQRVPGSTSLVGNSAGVQNYRDMAAGVAATIKTLNNGRYNDILAGLRTGRISTSQNFAGLKTWSGGGYNSLNGVRPADGAKAYTATSATTSSGSTDIGGLGKNATDAQVIAEIEKHYGYMAAFMNIPEIRKVMLTAVREGWADDQSRMQGALGKTEWWRKHSQTTRDFIAQGKLDPATQKTQIAQRLTNLQSEAKRLGVIVDPARLSSMAVNSLRYGWDDQQIRNAMVSEGKFDFTGKTGSASLTLRDNLKARAAQYMVPISSATMLDWVKNVTKGDVSEQDFDGYLKEQAKSLFPGLAAAIDRGVTVEQYADPYRQLAAQSLEIDPQAVDFMQPKWQKALQQVDPKTGTRVSMSLADWQNTLRSDPVYGWDKTQNARQSSADLTTKLADMFGAV